MRQIVLDTETTGIGHDIGHRIIEIGCVELIDRRLTGHHRHWYINPEREIDEGAFRVHGISYEFLQDKPLFQNIIDELLQYVDQAELVIHNAPFDIGFLNAELMRLNHAKKITDYCTVFDTLAYARKKFPGQRNSLDALCKRFDIDNSNRQLHGALLDSQILAYVYLALTGGQTSLFGDEQSMPTTATQTVENLHPTLNSTSPVYFANTEEQAAHQAFIQFLVEKSGVNLWND